MSLAPAHSFACAFSTSSCLPAPLLAAALFFFYLPFLLAIHQQHGPVKKKKKKKKEHKGNNKQKKKQKEEEEEEEEKVLVIIIMAATSLSMAIVPSCSSASAVKASSSSQVTTAIPLSDWLLLLWLLFFYSSTSSPSGYSCFRIIPFVFCGMRVKMRVCMCVSVCLFSHVSFVLDLGRLCLCLFVCFSSVAVFYGLVRLCDRQAYSCRSLGFGFSFWKALSCCRGLSFRPWFSSSSEWFTLWDLYSCVHFFVFCFVLFCWSCGTKAISVDNFDLENASNCVWFLVTS